MPKIETVGFNPNNIYATEDTIEIINITASVGANGVNLREDVVVVQAMLKYTLERRPYFRGTVFPEPTGADAKATAELIKKYQRFNNKTSFIKVPIDGRIDPLKDGMYAHGTSKQWTIYSLQADALEIALLNGHPSMIEGICRRWSFIRGIFNLNGVGSLGLELE